MTRSTSIRILSIVLWALIHQASLTGQQVVYEGVVHFDSDKADLTQAADSILVVIADAIDKERDTILIKAHTDAQGALTYNRALSQRRAYRVSTWFIDHGYPEQMIRTDWKGEIDSMTTNANESGRSLNRRATITILRPRRMVEYTGLVTDSADVPLIANVIVTGADFVDSVSTDSTGKFAILIPDSAVLSLDISSHDHVYLSRMFNSGREREAVIKLQTIKPGVVFQLHRFYFVGNQDVFLKPSIPELGRLLKFMKDNGDVTISIEGHINFPHSPPVDKASSHYDLSVRRARAVYNYLVDHGIDAHRLAYEGFGNWHMVYPRATSEEQQSKNRRVEVRVTGY